MCVTLSVLHMDHHDPGDVCTSHCTHSWHCIVNIIASGRVRASPLPLPRLLLRDGAADDFNGPLSGRFGPGPPSCGQAGCTRYLWAGDSQVGRRRTAIGPIVGPLLEPGISGCEPSPGVFCVVTKLCLHVACGFCESNHACQGWVWHVLRGW